MPDEAKLENTPTRVWFEACSDCGAAKGEPCVDLDGTHGAPHPARVAATVAVAVAMTGEQR